MSVPREYAAAGAAGALGELSQEHGFVQPLLERLVELGNRINSGRPVQPKTALIGVALLDAYLHRVHVGQEDRDLRPEAGQICSTHLGNMRTNHSEMCRRTQQVLLDIRQWASGDDAISCRVGRGIIELASKDYEAVQYEETYALACLLAELPELAGIRLQARLVEHQGTRKALEERIGRFLDGTYRT